MLLLPPLDSLRFFEAAARHQSFARAGEELGVTPASVAHRIGMLEKHLEVPLLERRHRSVRLNRRGRAYLKEVQRILAEVHGVSERQRRWPRRIRIVSVEAVAEKWLVPRLATFKAEHPTVAIELETNHRGVDPDDRNFDAWFAYTGETAAPRPVTSREDTLLEETLYEEDLLPVCSPALLAALGRPPGPGRPGGVAAALRSRVGRRLGVLVHAPGPVDAGPLAGLRLPPLQHVGPGRSARHRRRRRAPDADRARAGEQNAGPGLRSPGRGARTLLPHHHDRLPATARGPGIPGVGPGRGHGRGQQRNAPSVTDALGVVSPPAPRAPPRARSRAGPRRRRSPAIRRYARRARGCPRQCAPHARGRRDPPSPSASAAAAGS